MIVALWKKCILCLFGTFNKNEANIDLSVISVNVVDNSILPRYTSAMSEFSKDPNFSYKIKISMIGKTSC